MTILQKITTVDAIVHLLTSRINEGIYVPGEKLPSERLLQKELGVGRLALREALSRLNATGVIATAHGKGTFVQDNVKSKTFRDVLIPYFALNSTKRLHDLVVARGMLESEIAGLAALQRTDEDLVSLIRILEYKFPSGASSDEVANQDLMFHRAMANIIDNSFLAAMHEALIGHIQLFLSEYVKSKRNHSEVMDAHLPIIRAIEQGDVEGARHQARLHVSFSVTDYEEYMDKSKRGTS
jgi:GntR family transcriptional repressor for pyruvate dehydrogenase complex